MIPGELITEPGELELNTGLATVTVTVLSAVAPITTPNSRAARGARCSTAPLLKTPLKNVPAVALGNGSRWSCAAPDLESKVTASNSSGPRMLGCCCCVVWWPAARVLAASGKSVA